MRVVYVSPLRALSNDMHLNLEVPLAEILAQARADGLSPSPIRAGLRTGDTPSHRRAQLVKHPPHIFVTTPESLYLMLTAEKSRDVLRTVDTIIVDEIHALVRDKRGSHLSLSLERLAALTNRPLQRIGLSATQKPIERIAEFLVGVESAGSRVESGSNEKHSPLSTLRSQLSVVDVGHARDLDLAIEVPPSELSAVCSYEQWAEVHARLVELIQQHRSTLIFVNTRRMAERVTHQLTELLGEEAVGSHHGSLAADIRLSTEQNLKEGRLKAVVATASLELGIDVGHIDLVVQLGSPRSIATFLQRIGRSGHALGLVPKGRLFALTRDELLECMALIRAIKAGRLDAIPIPEAPLDVLAQQIVAESAAQEWNTDDLFALCRRAFPYRHLAREQFDRVLRFLSEGIGDSAGRSHALIHHDHVNRRVRGRRGARLTAINNGGAIAEIDSVRVVLDPERTVVGSVDEDFAVESMGGDIFLLGNTSWRIQQLRGNDLLVTDAHGAPPTIPFWRGEAPGRTVELSEEVSRLRSEIEQCLTAAPFSRVPTGRASSAADASPPLGTLPARSPLNDDATEAAQLPPELLHWLAGESHCSDHAASQVLTYVAAQKAAIGLVPTQTRIVFERFFDESGGMQLVVHAPFGGRINRAWGLAMRKRFCRSFDFELQASADDDGFILSLGPQHSFPIESLFGMLRPDNVRNLLEQALLAVPTFHLRWRWNATRALQVARQRNGKKVPPALQRFRSEDLLTAVFPKLTGCQENITGDHEIPDHPLIQQTVDDCLHEALDLDGLIDVLRRVETGDITFVPRDTREPSPFAYELLNANPYAFLDGGEIQERRARAVATRRSLTIDSVRDLGRLDPAAIGQVIAEAQPLVRSADELHDVLLSRILLPVGAEASACDEEMRGPPGAEESRDGCKVQICNLQFAVCNLQSLQPYLDELICSGRAASVRYSHARSAWVAAERWPAVQAMFPDAVATPRLAVPDTVRDEWTSIDARVTAVRGLVDVCGPATAQQVADLIGITQEQAFAALEALEGEGTVLRGCFREPHGPQNADSSTTDLSTLNSPPSTLDSPEWCHRRLLARIHRLTMAGLRREIEPVDVPIYFRFLFRHHGVTSETRRSGANGLFETLGQLQGLDIPAVAWERDILPLRLSPYRGEWLDELCLTGEAGWGRLYPPPRDHEKSRPMASITRVAPISVFLRDDLWWLAGADDGPAPDLSSPAQLVLELLHSGGAMFATDLLTESGLLPAQLDDVLGELVSRGLLTSDGFAGLRNLVRVTAGGESSPANGRGLKTVRRRRSTSSTGRWSLWRRKQAIGAISPDAPLCHRAEPANSRSVLREVVEYWAWQLLRRWGVVFKDLLRRESGAPAWYELLQVYRRLEARGEIRGGRFVAGVAGEQFALGDTVRELRRLRDEPAGSEVIVVSAADPLNLVGVIDGEDRIAASASNLVAFVGGHAVAAIQAGELSWLRACPADVQPAVLQCMGLQRKRSDNASPERGETQPFDGLADRDGTAESQRRKRPRVLSGIPRPRIS
jgi:ATP-dependent Lhr-like helicase